MNNNRFNYSEVVLVLRNFLDPEAFPVEVSLTIDPNNSSPCSEIEAKYDFSDPRYPFPAWQIESWYYAPLRCRRIKVLIVNSADPLEITRFTLNIESPMAVPNISKYAEEIAAEYYPGWKVEGWEPADDDDHE